MLIVIEATYYKSLSVLMKHSLVMIKQLRLTQAYSELYYNRGNTLKELKRFDEALASYDQAIKINPDYAAYVKRRCFKKTNV